MSCEIYFAFLYLTNICLFFSSLRSSSATNFQNLANEIIYEIFDFMDIYHIYQAFPHINQRFKKIIIDSTLPIKINILSLPNAFIIDNILSSAQFIQTFSQLKKLILDNIEVKHAEDILNNAKSLPKLYSLIINIIDPVEDSNNVYRTIFRLPVLKYCKVSFQTECNINSFQMSNNEYSPIEYLVIENDICFDVLDRLLSYIPELRHLKFCCLDGYNSKRTQLYPLRLNHLSNVSLELRYVRFNKFQQLMKDTFHQVQLLRIATEDDITYVDGNLWEELILSSMTNLRIFHMTHSNSLLYNDKI